MVGAFWCAVIPLERKNKLNDYIFSLGFIEIEIEEKNVGKNNT